jgi:hypothetical protein
VEAKFCIRLFKRTNLQVLWKLRSLYGKPMKECCIYHVEHMNFHMYFTFKNMNPNFLIKLKWTMSYVITQALGLRPRQGHGKVQARNVNRESHSHSWECERVWWNEFTHFQVDFHFGSCSPDGLFRERFEESKFTRLRISL